MDTGLLILRMVAGLLLIGHGAQKLAGWFGGKGLAGTADAFRSMGYRRGRPMAALAGTTEVGGGLLLALGLFTPLAAAAFIGVMASAIRVHVPRGLWVTNGGFEYPLVLAVVAAALAFTGPGAVSVDRALLGWSGGGPGWGLLAVVVGSLGAAAVVVADKRASVPVAPAELGRQKDAAAAAQAEEPRRAA